MYHSAAVVDEAVAHVDGVRDGQVRRKPPGEEGGRKDGFWGAESPKIRHLMSTNPPIPLRCWLLLEVRGSYHSAAVVNEAVANVDSVRDCEVRREPPSE